jgi:alkyldihydroxyacetonephosphate synthase
MDNLQFQFGQALKPERTGLAAWKSAAEKLFVTRVLGFDPQKMVACTLLFEGRASEVDAQEKRLRSLAKKHGGMWAGPENGERGYQLTFAIAYIRDFMLDHWVIGESFETSVPWSEAQALCANVKQRLWQEYAKRGLPGNPFVCCRVTQLYDNGVCVYFYFAFAYKGVEHASEVYAELERAARDEILRSGGSLSHHHGVGKLRQPFLPRVFSPAALAWRRALKRSIDPDNLLAGGNG